MPDIELFGVFGGCLFMAFLFLAVHWWMDGGR